MKRVAILLATSLLLSPPVLVDAASGAICAPPVDYALLTDEGSSGIGGTGRATPPETGIGGTGRALPGDSGIGGTGRSDAPGGDGGIGGTGIVGTITGFASICVNGLEVHYDAAVPVSDNGLPSTARGLAVGQVVAVEAGNSPRGLEAKRIAVLHALVGPVTRSPDQHGQFEVMGAKVVLPQAQQDQARTLKAGDWVKVSGHPVADQRVLASRVTRIDAGGEVSVSGRADPERQRVGAVAVDRTGAGELTVRGSWDGQRLQVRDSRPADGTVWAERPARVVIETRVRQRDGQAIRTGRADVDAVLAERRGRDADNLSEGTLLRITGRLDPDGKLRPLRIERAHREDERQSRSGADADQGKDGNRGRSDEDRDAKDARKALEKQQKDQERIQREQRDASDRRERGDRSDRNDNRDRTDRIEKAERIDRSGRDH
jgi:hypothetical protein